MSACLHLIKSLIHLFLSYGPNDGAMAGPGLGGGGWMDAVQRTLYGFGQFSQLLDGSYFSMHESFSSLMEFLHVIGELRHHISFVLKVSER